MLDPAIYPTRTSTMQILSQAQNVTAQWWWQYHQKSLSEEKHLKILSSGMVAEINGALKTKQIQTRNFSDMLQ